MNKLMFKGFTTHKLDNIWSFNEIESFYNDLGQMVKDKYSNIKWDPNNTNPNDISFYEDYNYCCSIGMSGWPPNSSLDMYVNCYKENFEIVLILWWKRIYTDGKVPRVFERETLDLLLSENSELIKNLNLLEGYNFFIGEFDFGNYKYIPERIIPCKELKSKDFKYYISNFDDWSEKVVRIYREIPFEEVKDDMKTLKIIEDNFNEIKKLIKIVDILKDT